MGDEADRALERVESAWKPFEAFLNGLEPADFDHKTAAAWTVKEMLAHVAFWDEAVVPVITYMLRGEPIPEGDWFASGYRTGDTWPSDTVHNAREAEWGRTHSGEEVRTRVTQAHDAMTRAVGAISDDEAAQRASYIQEQCEHYQEHLAELHAAVGG